MFDVAFAAGEQIVGAKDLMALREKPVAQMRTQKAGASGDQYAFTHVVFVY